MSKEIYRRGHNVVWQDDDGKITIHALDTMTPEEATGLAVAVTTAVFPHLPSSRNSIRQSAHQEDPGDACMCANCVHSMG